MLSPRGSGNLTLFVLYGSVVHGLSAAAYFKGVDNLCMV